MNTCDQGKPYTHAICFRCVGDQIKKISTSNARLMFGPKKNTSVHGMNSYITCLFVVLRKLPKLNTVQVWMASAAHNEAKSN